MSYFAPTQQCDMKNNVDTIGSAWMDENGTITLRLRLEGPGVIGDSVITYDPSDEGYDTVINHLGGLRCGETKPVPAWPADFRVQSNRRFAPPLRATVSAQPAGCELNPGTTIQIVDKHSDKGIVNLTVTYPNSRANQQYTVRWVCDRPQKCVLLELCDRTFEPETTPQLIARVIDARNLEVVAPQEFEALLESMHKDIAIARNLTPAAWNAQLANQCKNTFEPA